jgi:hypothetical protein
MTRVRAIVAGSGLLVVAVIVSAPTTLPDRRAAPTTSSSVELVIERLDIPELKLQQLGTVQLEQAIPQQEQVFTDERPWTEFWARYGIKNHPTIDFNHRRAAGIFLGTRSAGWAVAIERVSYDPARALTTIHVVELQPDPDKVYPAVLIFPADVVAFETKPGRIETTRATPYTR